MRNCLSSYLNLGLNFTLWKLEDYIHSEMQAYTI